MIWRILRDCAEQRHVFSCRLERDFETCTVVHTQSMRKQHSFIFRMEAAWLVLQTPRVCPRGPCYKSAKEIQSPHPGLTIGSRSHQIPRHARVCSRGQPPPPPPSGMAADKCISPCGLPPRNARKRTSGNGEITAGNSFRETDIIGYQHSADNRSSSNQKENLINIRM